MAYEIKYTDRHTQMYDVYTLDVPEPEARRVAVRLAFDNECLAVVREVGSGRLVTTINGRLNVQGI